MADHGLGGHAAGHPGGHEAKPSGGVNRRAGVFVSIIVAALALAFLGLQVLKVYPALVVVLFLFVAGILFLSPTLAEFKEFERGVRFRFGKFKDVIGPGWFIVFPSFERIESVDMRDQMVDIPPQQVVTKDNVRITIDAVTYIRVVDPRKAVIEIKDYQKAITSFLVAEVRNIISKLELEGVLEKTEDINALLHSRLRGVAEKWGVTATRVEVEHVVLPPELVDAMTKRQAAAEAKRRVQLESEARQIAISAVNEAASNISANTMNYLYLDALRTIGTSKSTKIVLPADLTRPTSRGALSIWMSREMSRTEGGKV